MVATPNAFGPDIRESHRGWYLELQHELGPALEPGAGVWVRWRGAQYLQHTFMPRFREEQAAIQALTAQSPAASTKYLWALGELIELLLDQLGELGHLAQGGANFAQTAGKFLRAFECWCEEAEHAGVSPAPESFSGARR